MDAHRLRREYGNLVRAQPFWRKGIFAGEFAGEE